MKQSPRILFSSACGVMLLSVRALSLLRSVDLVFRRRSHYWETRYRSGGNSGIGSYGEFAKFKAEVINEFVSARDVRRVIEFGCGDGNQLSLMHYPEYVGIDVSATAVKLCRKRFAADHAKKFFTASERARHCDCGFDLALSLDVIFHLTEDALYEGYMRALFAAPDRFVIIYSSNGDPTDGTYSWASHIRHRRFTEWIESYADGWRLIEKIPNRFPFFIDEAGEHGSFADFYVFSR